MTRDTFHVLRSVAEGLRAHGYEAYVEYPGWISVDVGRYRLAIGTANEVWGLDILDDEEHVGTEGAVDTDVPGTETDPERILAALLPLVEDCAEDETAAPCPECERSHGPHYRGRCDH